MEMHIPIKQFGDALPSRTWDTEEVYDFEFIIWLAESAAGFVATGFNFFNIWCVYGALIINNPPKPLTPPTRPNCMILNA